MNSSESPIDFLYPDLKNELAATRRVLERYPENNADWKPHDKSMALGPLASHLAELPNIGADLFEQDEVDVATRERKPPATNARDLLSTFDASVAKMTESLAKISNADLEKSWTLRFGEKVLVTGKKRALMRTLLINHIIHHRAQLGVYYRLLGIAVPGTYGPSADEPIG